MNYAKELEFAKGLAAAAGKIMKRYFQANDIGIQRKEDDSPVTVADTMINKLVIEQVKESFPSHGVLGEEESYEPAREKIWVVDPIDGTVPFSIGMPISTFSLAMVDRTDGQPVVAVAFDPYLDNLYTATKSGGAFLNGSRIMVSGDTKLAYNYASVLGEPVKIKDIYYRSGECIDKFREMGMKSIALQSYVYAASRVASGELIVAVLGYGSPWDTAAVCLLVREAGGVVTDLDGKNRRFDEFGDGCIVAANQSVLLKALEVVRS